MKKYLVGGAVRDSLLNIPVVEKDWVITGSSPQEMLDKGYAQVGKDFPVFLHPKNHEEYALARTERKSGPGYTGFVCHTHPDITIEEDLYRRDLTINAMAYDTHGNLLDPYHGQKDMKLKLLRHVSHSFYEDPLRVLRVARFAAKFKNLGFTIATETLKLMQHMTHELQYLPAERIWMETKKALITNNPQTYFQVLKKCGALKILFPELDILFTIPIFQPWHKNIKNLGEHTMIKLSNIACLTNDLSMRYAILFCNINTINDYISKSALQHSHNNNNNQDSIIYNLCNRLKTPHDIYKLSKTVAIYYNDLFDITKLSSEKIMIIFQTFNCWNCPDNIEKIICINRSHLLGNKYHVNHFFLQENFLRTALMITMKIKTHDIINDGFYGYNISQELYSRRLNILKSWNRKILTKLNTTNLTNSFI